MFSPIVYIFYILSSCKLQSAFKSFRHAVEVVHLARFAAIPFQYARHGGVWVVLVAAALAGGLFRGRGRLELGQQRTGADHPKATKKGDSENDNEVAHYLPLTAATFVWIPQAEPAKDSANGIAQSR